MSGAKRPFSEWIATPLTRAVSALAVGLASFGVVIATSGTVDAGVYDDTNQCVAGTFLVRHGVTHVDVTAIGQAGEDGNDVTQNRFGGPEDWQGGTGGLGSRVVTRIPVTTGQTLYVGVANGTMGGGARASDGRGGKGGSASWVVTADPRVNGECKPTQASAVVVAAGGGGGGAAGNRFHAHPGGGGGTEATGGNGGDGAEYSDAIWGDSDAGGHGGHFPSASAGGGGGLGGGSAGCTSGQAGFAGAALNGGAGGQAGVPTLNDYDCSTPPPDCDACQFADDPYGGAGGGGGGGLWGGGGGGGADSGGFGAGGGGASGRSYAKDPASYALTSTRIPPMVTIQAVTTPPEVTNGSAATFTRGTFGSTPGSATGVETPYVRFKGTLPNGVANVSGTFADDGSGNGTATLSGTPSQDGVFPLTVEACNSAGCDEEPFTLTVNGSPGFTNADRATFVVGAAGSHAVRTSGYPAPAIAQFGAPAWLTLTDHGDGTATLGGTPPAGAANQYVVNLTAANGIGSNAAQAITIKVVTALSVDPPTVHLAPGNSSPAFQQYSRVFKQQLRAIGTFPDGSTGDITGFVRWDSSAPGTASVTDAALVTAHALGTATVTARTAAATTATSSIVVAMPLSIAVVPATVSLLGGQTQQFVAMGCYGSPCSSSSFDISDNVLWSVTNNDAHVTADGLATAHQGGTVSTVMAEVFAGIPGLPSVRGEGDITITHGDVVEVVVTPAGRTVVTGTVVRYDAMLRYQDGTLVHDSPYVTWSASGIAGATIGPAGDVQSLTAGTLTVTATFTNPGGGTVQGNTTLTVIQVPSSLVVSPVSGAEATPLVKGGTRQYKAVAHYSNGTEVDVTNGVEWVSTDPAVIEMSPTGLVTAKGSQQGDATTILARYTYTNVAGGTSELTDTSVVTLTLTPPVSLAITPTSPPELRPNDNLQFTATGTYADGSTVDLTHLVKDVDGDGNAVYHVMWSSTNTFVGVVNDTGGLHVPSGPTVGTVTVSASIIGPGFTLLHSNDVVVTVTDPLDHVMLRSLSPTGSPSFIVAGTSTLYPYWVEGFDEDNNSLGDVTDDSTITMSPDGACDPVLLTCGATVADVGLNRHTIQATNPGAVHPASNAIQIQVVRANTTRVEITGGSTSIVAGQSTAPYHVTGYDAFGNAWDATNQTAFSVQPVEVTSGCNGSPGNTPTCYAVTAGAHTVRASVSQGAFVETLPLYVHANPVLHHITLSGGATNVPVGTATPPYLVTGYDAYGNSGNVTLQTELSITPDGTCDNTAFTCTPASMGPHSVTARRIVGSDLTSNALPVNAVAPPTVEVTATPASVVKGAFASFVFTIRNPNPSISTQLTGISFDATIPPSLLAFQFINQCPGSQFQTPDGGLHMSNITLFGNNSSCTFSYIGTASAAGAHTSTTSNVTSANGGSSSATDSATLDVSGPPLLTKSFVAGSVTIGSTTPLTFTVTNPNTSLTLTGIGFMDTLPAGLAYANTTITGSCGGAVMSIQGSTLYVGPDGANGAIGSGAHGATLAPGASCTFSVDVRADTLGTKNNATSNVTSNERGTGPQGLDSVVVTPPVDHFDIEMVAMAAGEPAQLAVVAYDRFNNVVTGYAGIPTLTGDFSDSATGCGPAETDPCGPVYELPQFVDGASSARVTAYQAELFRSVTVTDGAVVSHSSVGLNVGPGAFDHITLEGGTGSISAGSFASGYGTRRWDKYGNVRPGSSHTLSISPDGLCNGFDSCTAQVADTDSSRHTVTAISTLARADGTFPVATRPLYVGHGPVSRITVDGGNRTLVAGQTTQPYTIYGWDVFDNEIGDLPVSDVHFTIDPNGTCDDTTRKCTVTVADPPGWYHMVRATHVSGPFADGDQLVVSAAPLHHLVLAPDGETRPAGQFVSYLAVGYDAFGNALGDKTAQTTFTIDDGDCVDSSCRSGTAGARTVTGTLGTATGTATLHVTAGQLHHIQLTGGSPSIVVGEDTAPYAVMGFDASNNSLGDVTSSATLSINPDGSCDNVAHTCTADIADNGGFHVVEAFHPGAIGGPTTTANLTVTNTPVVVDHIALTGGSPAITVGTPTAPYVVTAYDASNASLGVVTNAVTLSIAPNGTCNQVAHTCSATVADTGGSHHTVTATHPTATNPTATSNVVVNAAPTEPGALHHFGIAVQDLAAGQNGQFAVTAYDADGNVVTGYSGTPSLTGTLGTSTKACGPVGQDPCPPQYFMGGFSNGVATAHVKSFKADVDRTVTVTDGAVVSTSDPFDVRPDLVQTAALSGGSASIPAGGSTNPYVVTGYDVFGNVTGDLTGDSTFEILPNGSCTGAVCTATSAGLHVVQATTSGVSGVRFVDLNVLPGALASMFVIGDFESTAGVPTSPYVVIGVDGFGGTVRDLTDEVTLSLGPDGSCEQVTHTCVTTVADTPLTIHTVTATHPDLTAPGTAFLFVLPGSFDHIALVPDEATIPAGGSQVYAATSRDEFGNEIADVTPDTTFGIDDGSCSGPACTSTTVGERTVTGAFEGNEATATLNVDPGALDHITLTGGSATVDAGTATAPYQVLGWDAYDNPLGDVTGDSPLSITPSGACDQVAHTCTPAAGGGHTVTATNDDATDPTATKALSVNAPVGADVRLTKTGPASVIPGGNVTYNLSARNFGPATATGVTVSDPFPAGTSFVSETHPAGWTCTTAGTYSCTKASLTVAEGAQAFTLVLHVDASATGPIANTATVSATSPDPTPGNDTPPAVSTTIGCPGGTTITGLYAGDLTLSGAGTTCLRNVTVTGKLSVLKGHNLVAINAIVGRATVANGAGAVTFCGSQLRSSVSIVGSKGFVLVGDPGDDGCAGNTITGNLDITGGLAGLNLRSNTLLSSAVVDKNKGGGPFPVDANPIVAANTVGGRLACKGNTPAPINAGQPNTAPSKSGQCTSL